ncbi:MAG: hypothetical protein HXO03_05760 [Prevotella salivae]|nr:hypothetical protein [Segatella salivae]
MENVSIFDLVSFSDDNTSLYFYERDLDKYDFDMLDIADAFPDYDFVERESDGRLIFHLN